VPTITSLVPTRVVEGGRVALTGSDLPTEVVPSVVVGQEPARTLFASSTKIVINLPPEIEGGRIPVRIEDLPGETVYLSVGSAWATGLHQVDNPVFDREGNLFVTYSGSRGQEAPISVFRVTPAGTREPFVSGIVNATSMAFGPDGHLYVSSRFEGAVYRVNEDGTHKQVASDLGVACGLAFDADGWMYVGDRSGTIFRTRDGETTTFASLPPSVAAFHLAMSPDGDLFVSGPTLGTYDHIHRINDAGEVRAVPTPFGRPQGLVFAPDGSLHVIDALAGASGLYRFATPDSEPELVVSGGALVGVAFGPNGELVVSSNDTVYRFE
jgi:sugar lactone lactonase YvrE